MSSFPVPPAGTSAVGFFILTEHTVPGAPVGILADAVDPGTREYLSIERGFDPTDAAVLAALSTERGSGSAVMNCGQKYRQASHITPQLQSFFQQETEFALQHLIDSRQIRLDEVLLETEGTAAELHVHYFNLARQQDRKAVLPLGALLPVAA
jgi:hypothetical protein